MSNLKFDVHGTVEDQTITILEGEAPKPQNPQAVKISGRLDAPGNFFEKRKETFPKENGHVIADYKNRFITLVINPGLPNNKVEVRGELKMDHRLSRFGINTDQKYTRDELALLCKFNRSSFSITSEGTGLVKKLRDFKIKFDQSLESNQDQRGNQKLLMERVINECDLPEKFTLFLPVFSGEKETEIDVDLLFDVAGSGDVVFWLESPSLEETIETQTEDLIDIEIERMQDLVIIYQ